jgi:hypothetical protein
VLRTFFALVLLFCISGFVVACGGDDDDGGDDPFLSEDDDSGDDDSGSDDGDSGDDDDSDDGDSGNDDGSSDDEGSDDDSNDQGDLTVDIPEIKDGAFEGGSLHIEISGEKDDEFDFELGTGFALGGFANVVYSTEDASRSVTFAFAKEGDPGAIAVIAGPIITGGTWGRECSVTVHDDDDELRAEFECDDAQGLASATGALSGLRIEGEFTINRIDQ